MLCLVNVFSSSQQELWICLNYACPETGRLLYFFLDYINSKDWSFPELLLIITCAAKIKHLFFLGWTAVETHTPAAKWFMSQTPRPCFYCLVLAVLDTYREVSPIDFVPFLQNIDLHSGSEMEGTLDADQWTWQVIQKLNFDWYVLVKPKKNVFLTINGKWKYATWTAPTSNPWTQQSLAPCTIFILLFLHFISSPPPPHPPPPTMFYYKSSPHSQVSNRHKCTTFIPDFWLIKELSLPGNSTCWTPNKPQVGCREAADIHWFTCTSVPWMLLAFCGNLIYEICKQYVSFSPFLHGSTLFLKPSWLNQSDRPPPLSTHAPKARGSWHPTPPSAGRSCYV